MDEKDPMVIAEVLECDPSDDFYMENCKNALPDSETMQVRMIVNEDIPRIEMDKTFKFTFWNERDRMEGNKLYISKTYNIERIPGAGYS